VYAAQFLGLPDLALNALGMRAVVDRPNFAVLAAANDSLFGVYGPGFPDNFCAISPKAGADGGDYACQLGVKRIHSIDRTQTSATSDSGAPLRESGPNQGKRHEA
jgi:hypothetical protein